MERSFSFLFLFIVPVFPSIISCEVPIKCSLLFFFLTTSLSTKINHIETCQYIYNFRKHVTFAKSNSEISRKAFILRIKYIHWMITRQWLISWKNENNSRSIYVLLGFVHIALNHASISRVFSSFLSFMFCILFRKPSSIYIYICNI